MVINRRSLLFFGVIAALLFLSLAFIYWSALLSPIHDDNEFLEISIDVPKNSSCSTISEIIYNAGLVRGPKLISGYARLHGIDQNFKPGRYLFKTNQSIPEIVASLVKGPEAYVVFTVPEGFNLEQLTGLLVQKGLVNEDKFKAALDNAKNYNYPFIKNIPKGIGLEGYLFPDTYYVGYETTEEQIVAMMLDKFQSVLEDMNYVKKAEEANLTLHQAVIIASLVEGEAAVEEERPLIAGVIFNRLRLDMPLQIDATVKYALGGNRDKIYYKDLEVESPYNTYRIKGLPPGPINLPGRASLEAAVNPAKTDYLYYVAKKDGSHAFATTLQEHNNNIEKINTNG
jgi:UPF0755 protein